MSRTFRKVETAFCNKCDKAVLNHNLKRYDKCTCSNTDWYWKIVEVTDNFQDQCRSQKNNSSVNMKKFWKKHRRSQKRMQEKQYLRQFNLGNLDIYEYIPEPIEKKTVLWDLT